MTLNRTPLTPSPVVVNGVVIGPRPATQEEILRNVERWQKEQKEKDQKRKAFEAEAKAKGITLKALHDQKRFKVAPVSATISELMKRHLQQK